LDAAKQLAKDFGTEFNAVFVTQGSFDLAVVAEMPNDETVLQARFEAVPISLALSEGAREKTVRPMPGH